MGLVCCRGQSPCGSAEERSGLLTDESKTNMPTGETVVVGTCGLETEDDMRKPVDEASIKASGKEEVVEMTQNLENGELEPSNTQVNGPLQKESVQATSPHKGSENNKKPSTAQDEKRPPGDGGQDEHLQCTLVPQQKLHTAAHLDSFTTTEVSVEENPASDQDRVPDGGLLTAGAICSEKPSQTEPTATREHSTESPPHDSDEEEAGSKVTNDSVVAVPSGEDFPKPNLWLTPTACQVSSRSMVGQEISKEAQNSAVTEDSSNGSSALCEQAGAEDIKRPDVPKCSGPEPAGITHSSEKRDSVSSVGDPQTTAPAGASESLKSTQDADPDPESLKEATSSEIINQDTGEELVQRVHDKGGEATKTNESDLIRKKEPDNTPPEADIQEVIGTDVKTDTKAEVTKNEDSVKDDLENSEEDLYRGAEELSASQNNKSQASPVLETKFLKVEDRCSLAPAMDILSYSEREWKGNTAKSALIRKGYKEMSQRFGSLRRVRGDNYCALRATLFQLLSHSTQLPTWLQDEDFIMLPKQLEAEDGLISQWTFPGDCLQGDGMGDATQQLKGYMKLLQNTWQEAVDCPSAVERRQLCERVFQGGEEELGLLEALKLLMLGRAVQLHGCMQSNGDVPVFCWLLFARDSSTCPRSFLSNHLSHVGLSAGLEQVEMFLLGYALQCTIQVYRLYKADTEEFVTYYPDDHKDEWPCVCLVTEDDRHYNVPVVEAADLHEELNVS